MAAQEDRVRSETLKRLATAQNVQLQTKWKNFIRGTTWKKDRLLGASQAEVHLMLSQGTANRQSCARKTIRYGKTPEIVERIQQECNLFTLMSHPNVVQYYDYSIDYEKRRVHIYMELMHVCKLIFSGNSEYFNKRLTCDAQPMQTTEQSFRFLLLYHFSSYYIICLILFLNLLRF